MRQLRYIASLAIMLLAALPMQAQTENQAFYIYQNDGHFDGFFYDEIEKMSFSFLDTLGVEHDEIVSQEIFTADSVYRIMLSAIDSIGFVQPETKYGPQVYIKDKDPYFRFAVWDHEDNTEYGGEEVIIFSRSNLESGGTIYDPKVDDFVPIPQPQVGDIYASFDLEDGFMCKISEITRDYPGYEGWPVGYCKPIDDITDVFQQFVAVEEYGYDDEGTMVRRRVAGRPDLTVGNWNLPKKSTNRAGGQWEGDLFNFAINTHIPLYISDDLTVSVDPSIEGKLHLKTTWNLSLFGDKHISIHSKLNFGVGAGFTVDGKIADFFPGGIGGLLGGVPIPATCPLILLDIAPDAFLRGEAHINFKLSLPKLNGSMWTKLEISNWVPRIDIGFGNSDDGSEFNSFDNSGSRVSMSLNGFVQAGMLFPMKFKSLPVLKKIFDSEIGGQWFVGPKLAANFTIDLTTLPWEDVAAYKQLRNITAQMNLLDADYEVKGTVKTAFSGKKEVTLADGSISIFPPFEVSFVPDFDKCEEFYESHFVWDGVKRCRIFGFKPSGYVFKPVTIGCRLYEIDDQGKELEYIFSPSIEFLDMFGSPQYYHLAQLFGQELPKEHWARLGIVLQEGAVKPAARYGKFKVKPIVYNPFGGEDKYLIASRDYTFEYGISKVEASGDTLYVDYDGKNSSSLLMKGTCDHLRGNIDDLNVAGNKGALIVTAKQEKIPKNYNPVDSVEINCSYQGATTTDGEIFVTEDQPLTICVKPNKTEKPVSIYVRGIYYNTYGPEQHWRWTVTPTENGWFCSGVAEYYWQIHKCSFYIEGKAGSKSLFVRNGKYEYRYESSIGEIEEKNDSFDNIELELREDSYENPVGFTTTKNNRSQIHIYFKDFIDKYPGRAEPNTEG
jgi:hypothetical protein